MSAMPNERYLWLTLVLCLGSAAITITSLLFGVPWLWGLIKPWLHGVTG